jgi:RHS repeat-associated protein
MAPFSVIYTYNRLNRLATASNLTSSPQGGGQYDVENRLVASAGDNYAYGAGNLRVWKSKPDGTEELHIYGALSERLGTYPIWPIPLPNGQPSGKFYVAAGTTVQYFAGRIVGLRDRLESNGTYYPYGEDYGTPVVNSENFATYYRDGTTGLDYAKNRYYSSILGRFLTPDPYRASGGAADPGSWNRYAYVGGDPVNYIDPGGTCKMTASEPTENDLCPPLVGFGGPVSVYSYQAGTVKEWDDINPQGPAPQRFIHVTNANKTGMQEKRIRDVLDWINPNIDPDCADWLSGYSGAITALEGGDGSNPDTVLIGHGTFDTRSVSAFTGNNPSRTDLPPGYAMTVNDVGGFFVGSYPNSSGQQVTISPGGYTGGTSQAQVFVLLHELAHFLGAADFQGDFNSRRAGSQNDRLVKDNCKKTLNAAKSIP